MNFQTQTPVGLLLSFFFTGGTTQLNKRFRPGPRPPLFAIIGNVGSANQIKASKGRFYKRGERESPNIIRACHKNVQKWRKAEREFVLQ